MPTSIVSITTLVRFNLHTPNDQSDRAYPITDLQRPFINVTAPTVLVGGGMYTEKNKPSMLREGGLTEASRHPLVVCQSLIRRGPLASHDLHICRLLKGELQKQNKRPIKRIHSRLTSFAVRGAFPKIYSGSGREEGEAGVLQLLISSSNTSHRTRSGG